jgi:hypothetical protein
MTSRRLRPDIENVAQSAGKPPRIAEFALPNDQDAPTEFAQRGHVGEIPFAIALQLRQPKLRSRGRRLASWAIMAVPKAAMHEQDSCMTLQNDVGGPWKRTLVESKPQPQSVQNGADRALRCRIRRLHRPHVTAALRFGHTICH